MRRVACLLALSALSAQAETGPPTVAETAGADAACAVEVMQDCLLMIATGIALANPDNSESALNDIAFAQASLGDTEGAERTLSLTTPGFLALSALGRVDEATAAFKARAEKLGLTATTDPNPPSPGEVKLAEVERLLKTSKVDSALGTALSIDDEDRVAKPTAFRQIVDHHLAGDNIDAAIAVARMMESDPDGTIAELFYGLTGQYNDQRSDALAAIIAAQAAAADLEGATRLAEGLMEPRTQISARLALARAAFQTGATDLAKAQLVLVLSGVQALEPAPIFATMTLTESADLALRSGEMDIARTHSKAAHRAGTRPTVRRGGDSRPPAPSKVLLLNLATVLHLSGATDQAAPLLKRASVPYKDQGLSTLRSEQLATLLVAQVRLGDKEGAADTRAQLLAMDGIAWDDGRPFLHKAAVSLIDHGFLNEALAIADALEPGQRDDLLGFHGESPAALYAAILAKDPALAPEVLKDSLGARAHFIASLVLARSLLAAGQPEKARNVLESLPADHQRRALSEPKFLMNPICVLSFIALTEDELGLDADAEATRQEGLAFARAQSDPGNQTADILVLAASFPVESTASVSYGLGCIGYHP